MEMSDGIWIIKLQATNEKNNFISNLQTLPDRDKIIWANQNC